MYGSDTLSRTYRRFRVGRGSVKGDERSGHPQTSTPLKTTKRFLQRFEQERNKMSSSNADNFSCVLWKLITSLGGKRCRFRQDRLA
ncbi:hypothetical protein TNCV_922201 [Trichonephila clavipes]|nr:hypothetical protein TNCV_922201 [Trichonephila clavipes]